MSRAIALPAVHGPGLGWLPAVLRRRATWRTVWRFTWAGPLIGGLPYVWLLFTVPFAYAIGVLPAAVAGLLFAAWYHHPQRRAPTWPWRAAVGALAGLGGTAAVAALMLGLRPQPDWLFLGVVAAHGVPAALVLALIQKPVTSPGCPPPRP